MSVAPRIPCATRTSDAARFRSSIWATAASKSLSAARPWRRPLTRRPVPRRFVAGALSVASGVSTDQVTLAHDPQTSGGLLAAVPADRLADVESDLRASGVDVWRVGRVEGNGAAGVALRA